MSKNTGIDRKKPDVISETGQSLRPSSRTNNRTIRSAAPDSIRHRPITAAIAITIPILPAVVPKASATRVIFTATVPDYTTPDDTLYIAGGFQGWNPGGNPMTRVDDTTWQISLTFVDGESLEYKYARGSWEAVEKDAGCGEIPNRTVTVEYSGDGTQEVSDSVVKWRDLDGCP